MDHPHIEHRSPEMTIRYARLASPTLRAAYDQAIGKMRKLLPLASAGIPAIPDRLEWLRSEMLKTRVAHGYCAREIAADACPYANICETCPNFVTAPEFAPILAAQLADVRDLRDDAEGLGSRPPRAPSHQPRSSPRPTREHTSTISTLLTRPAGPVN